MFGSDVDNYVTNELLPRLMEYGITAAELEPLGVKLAERQVPTDKLPSEWSEEHKNIFLEILRTFLENRAYAASGETVPERVMREIGDVIGGVREAIEYMFENPTATGPTPSDAMYSVFTSLIKMGVPDEAMQRIGELL